MEINTVDTAKKCQMKYDISIIRDARRGKNGGASSSGQILSLLVRIGLHDPEPYILGELRDNTTSFG